MIKHTKYAHQNYTTCLVFRHDQTTPVFCSVTASRSDSGKDKQDCFCGIISLMHNYATQYHYDLFNVSTK